MKTPHASSGILEIYYITSPPHIDFTKIGIDDSSNEGRPVEILLQGLVLAPHTNRPPLKHHEII